MIDPRNTFCRQLPTATRRRAPTISKKRRKTLKGVFLAWLLRYWLMQVSS